MNHEQMKNYRRDTTIAEILHDAADVYLAIHDSDRSVPGHTKTTYSCIAIQYAIFKDIVGFDRQCYHYRDMIENVQYKEIMVGLNNMGFQVNGDSYGTVFVDYDDDENRQGARYMWLKLAALMAEEQGV